MLPARRPRCGADIFSEAFRKLFDILHRSFSKYNFLYGSIWFNFCSFQIFLSLGSAEAECDVEVRWHRQVRMLRPPTCPPGVWQGRQAPGFWHPKAKAQASHR